MEKKYLIFIKSTKKTGFLNPDLKGKIHSQNGVMIKGVSGNMFSSWYDIHEEMKKGS